MIQAYWARRPAARARATWPRLDPAIATADVTQGPIAALYMLKFAPSASGQQGVADMVSIILLLIIGGAKSVIYHL